MPNKDYKFGQFDFTEPEEKTSGSSFGTFDFSEPGASAPAAEQPKQGGLTELLGGANNALSMIAANPIMGGGMAFAQGVAKDAAEGPGNQVENVAQYGADLFNSFMGGYGKMLQSIGWLGEQIPESIAGALPFLPSDEGFQAMQEEGQWSSDFWLNRRSDEFKAKANAGLASPEFGVTTVMSAATTSLPEMVLTMGSGAVAGKLAQVGTMVGTARIAAAAEAGSVIAKKILQYSKYAPAAAGALAGGGTEGLMAAGASGVAMEQRVNAMSHDDLIAGSDRYLAVYDSAEGMPEAERRAYAKETVAQEMARSTAAWVGASTMALGAPTGALFGYLGGRAAGAAGASGIVRKLEGSVAGQAATGFAAEGAQEFLQEGSQQFLQNLGIREYADKKQALMEGVLDNAVIGGLAGGVMGGSITPLAGAEARADARAKGKVGEVESADETPDFKYSRNPILEAKIVEQLKGLEGAQVPPVEFQKVARWAQGRSALEFSKALEQLTDTGAAPEHVAAVTGEDYDVDGLLTEAAYNKDAAKFAFDVEMRIKPEPKDAIAVIEALAADGANPYLLKDGTLVVPQSKQGEAGLRAVAAGIQIKTGVKPEIVSKVNENQNASTEGTNTEVGASAQAAAAPSPEVLKKASDDFQARVESDFDTMVQEYDAIPETKGGQIIAGDIAKELSPEYLKDRAGMAAAIHEPASEFTWRLYEDRLSKPTPPGKDAKVTFLAGGTGAGKTSGLGRLSFGNPEVVYDSNMAKFDSAKERIDLALANGREVNVVYTYRDPVEAFSEGVLKRAMKQEKEFGTGRVIPLDIHAKTHVDSAAVIRQVAEHYKGDDRVTVTLVDNSRGRGQAAVVPVDKLPQPGDNPTVTRRINEELEAQYQAGRISEAVYRGVSGREAPVAQGVQRQVREGLRPVAERSGEERRPDEVSRRADGTVHVTPEAGAAALEEMGRSAAAHPGNDHEQPTDRELIAGNYPKGHGVLKGNTPRENIPVSIENVPGSIRRAVGGGWSRKMKHWYGYIRGTKNVGDGMLDVYIGKQAYDNDLPVFVVRQLDKDGKFDEPKVMLGYADEGAAKAAYLSEYPAKLAKLFGGITRLSRSQFADYLESGDTDVPPHPLSKKPMIELRGEMQPKMAPSMRLVAAGLGMKPLTNLPQRIRVDGKTVTFGPFQKARDAAAAYMRDAGMPYKPPTQYVDVVPERARMIAAYYHVMQHAPQDPEVKVAYDAMIAETLAQWQAIKATGLKVEFNPPGQDPYGNPRNAILDVVNNNHLYVFPTVEGFGSSDLDVSDNPLLATAVGENFAGKPVTVNDIFRVVHDYFGHIKEGVGFRADGEENAWRSHAAMYSPLARRAMTTETRGQNSWVNFGPYAAANREAKPDETTYADQKIGLLPEWVSEQGATGDGKIPAQPPLSARTASTQIADALVMAQSRGNDEAVKLLKRIDLIRDKALANIPAATIARATNAKPTGPMALPKGDDGAKIGDMVVRDVIGFLSSRPVGTQGLMFSLRKPTNVKVKKARKIERPSTTPLEEFMGKSVVVNKDGSPKLVYRGQHGEGVGNKLHSRMLGITFVDNKDTAQTYANDPNNGQLDKFAAEPNVLGAYLRIENPAFVSIDPFLELSEIVRLFGREEAMQIARKFEDGIYNTGNWIEDLGDEFESVDDMLTKAPERLEDLYFDAFRFLDDNEMVQRLKDMGYDGAIHDGNGESSGDTEYRVFSPDQVRIVTGKDLRASMPKKESAINVPGAMPDLMLTSGTYSALYHALQHERGVPKAATYKQWVEWLDGAQRRGLFRKEERDYTDIDNEIITSSNENPETFKAPLSRLLEAITTAYPKITETMLGTTPGSNGIYHDAESETTILDAMREDYRENMFEARVYYIEEQETEEVTGYEVEGSDEIFDTEREAQDYIDAIDPDGERDLSPTEVYGGETQYSVRFGRNDIEFFDSEDDAQEAIDDRNDEEFEEEWASHMRRLDDDEIIEWANDNGMADFLSGNMTQYEDWSAPGGTNYRELLFNMEDLDYTSPHFDKAGNADAGLDEGLVMHARVKDRVTVDGDGRQHKILYIEELQSDHHQEQRELPESWKAVHENGTVLQYFDSEEYGKNWVDAYQRLRDEKAELVKVNPKEPAPFAKSWQEVMTKHLIQYAAANGYDFVAWTTGMQQAERYRAGVSRAVTKIEWRPGMAAKNLRVQASPFSDNEWVIVDDRGIVKNGDYALVFDDPMDAERFIEQSNIGSLGAIHGFYEMANRFVGEVSQDGKVAGAGFGGEDLSAVVGNTIATAIMANPGELQVFDGRMVIGGKGMVLQYDHIIPKAAEKVAKKFGSSVKKVEQANWLERNMPGGQEAWIMDIPENMREAMSQPMPAYSKRAGRELLRIQDENLRNIREIVGHIAEGVKGMPDHVVVASEAGLPQHLREFVKSIGADGEIEGFLDTNTQRVYFIANNIGKTEGESLDDAIERIFAEEVLGHYGLRAVFGHTAMNTLFDQVWRDHRDTATMQQIVAEYAGVYGDPEESQMAARGMADEFLAKADRRVQPTVMNRIVAWAREQLRKMGWVREWSDNDLQVLMNRVFDAVRNGVVPSSLNKLTTALVQIEDNSPTITVRDGRGTRITRPYDGARNIVTDNYQVDVIDAFEDGKPAVELGSFVANRGGLASLASFLAEEGKRYIIAPEGMIPADQLAASKLHNFTSAGATVVELPEHKGYRSMVFSLRNRKRGSDEVETILAKTLQQHTSEMSWGQQITQWARELTGYFGAADTWQELKTGWIDSASAIERLERGQFDGKLLDASESAYKFVSLTKNLPQLMAAVSKVGVPVYQDGTFVRATGRKGLYDIFAPLFKTSDGQNLLHLWEGYAVARRSSQLIKQTNPDGTSKEKLLSPDEINKLLALEAEYPMFKKVFDDWQQFNRELLDLAVDRGALSKESADLWKQNDYVPFFRVEEEEETSTGVSRKRGLSGQKVTSKRLTGSDRRIQPVLENIMLNSAAILEKVYKNEAMNRIVALADGIAMTHEPMRSEAVKMSNEDIARALAKAGLFVGDDSNSTPEQRRAGKLLRNNDISYAVRAVEKMTPEQRESWTTFFRRVRPDGPDVVSVMVAGKPVYYRVQDPLLLRAIMDMTPVNFGALVDFMGGAKRLLTTLVTLDPGFMAANWMRDTLSSWVTVSEDLRPFRDAPGAAVEVWQEAGLAVDLAMAGGMTGGFYNPTQDFGDVVHDVSGATVLNSPKKLLDAYRKIGMVSEQVNRIAIAKAVLRRGGSMAEAAYQAQDVLNFSQSGDAVAAQLLIRTVPFLNARIQGLYRLWKGARGLDGRDPKKAMMAFFLKGLFLAGISMLLALKNRGDERYEKLPDFQKDTYWHFFIGDQHYAIPKPFEVGVMFATVPERAMRLAAGTDKGATTVKSVTRALGDTFAFNPVPQLFKPMVEQWANRSFFTDRPIVGLELEGLEPVAQYNPWTSETARGVANVVDQVVPDSMQRFIPETLRSPTRLEHAVRAYTGTIGGYLLQAADAALRKTGAFPEAPSMASIRDVPVLGGAAGRFVRGDVNLESGSKYADDLYDTLQRADDAYRTMNAYVTQGNVEAASKFVDRRMDLLSVRPVLHQFKAQASAINQQQRRIMASDLTPEQKREALDELTRTKNRLMRSAAPYLGLMEE